MNSSGKTIFTFCPRRFITSNWGDHTTVKNNPQYRWFNKIQVYVLHTLSSASWQRGSAPNPSGTQARGGPMLARAVIIIPAEDGRPEQSKS